MTHNSLDVPSSTLTCSSQATKKGKIDYENELVKILKKSLANEAKDNEDRDYLFSFVRVFKKSSMMGVMLGIMGYIAQRSPLLVEHGHIYDAGTSTTRMHRMDGG